LSLVAAILERGGERRLGTAVHRRGVEELDAGIERSADDFVCEPRVAVECVPGAEPDDRAETPLLHQASSSRAARPAA
jgi:hypothetical protein